MSKQVLAEASRKWSAANPHGKMHTTAKSRAKRKNVYFDITVEDIKAVYPEDGLCPVFGIPLERGQGRAQDSSPSLDRIDNTRGYEVGNIQIISWKANRLKNTMNLEELERLVEFIKGGI